MGRIMVSLLLTVCACVFSILSTEAAYGDWWANNRAPCTEPPCPPECPWPEDCRRNRGPQYPQFGARPQYPQFGARPIPQLPQYGNYGPQFPQYGNYGPQLPQYGNYGPQLPQYGNYGGLWGGNKAARPPRWWGQGPGTNIQIGK